MFRYILRSVIVCLIVGFIFHIARFGFDSALFGPPAHHGYRTLKYSLDQPPLSRVASLGPPRDESFSPGDDIERLDVQLIDHATGRLDIAMYSFTDQNLAAAVLRAAERGVTVRIYRDREQYEQESHRGGYTAETLARSKNISIRVKNSMTLMHLKAYSDGNFLREGSANWSRSGEQYQDNDAMVIDEPRAVQGFEQKFDQMWTRSDNIIVQ